MYGIDMFDCIYIYVCLQGKKTPLPNGEAVMCAYKLCKVEFRYWGMQTKIEKFIHDVGMCCKNTILT